MVLRRGSEQLSSNTGPSETRAMIKACQRVHSLQMIQRWRVVSFFAKEGTGGMCVEVKGEV
jgi:hypothetical protein